MLTLKRLKLPLFLAAAFLQFAQPMSAQEADGTMPLPQSYSIKPSDVLLPEGAEMGKYRRITTPFKNWTLLCDEDLKAKKRICNISQLVVDENSNVFFSWSLAATDKGAPVFIFRTPAVLSEGASIRLDLQDGGKRVDIPVKGCDASACIAYQTAGPRLRKAVDQGKEASVSFDIKDTGKTLSIDVPLEGLKEALAAI